MDASTCALLIVAAVAIVAYTIAAARDFLTGAPLGGTLRRWLRRVADAFFGVP